MARSVRSHSCVQESTCFGRIRRIDTLEMLLHCVLWLFMLCQRRLRPKTANWPLAKGLEYVMLVTRQRIQGRRRSQQMKQARRILQELWQMRT